MEDVVPTAQVEEAEDEEDADKEKKEGGKLTETERRMRGSKRLKVGGTVVVEFARRARGMWRELKLGELESEDAEEEELDEEEDEKGV